MNSDKNQPQKIIFLNEPNLSEHQADNSFNEKRLSLIPYVKEYISNEDRFKDMDVTITFSDKGISSLVCTLETPKEKVVLKVPLSATYSNGEAEFLKIWGNSGVKVPRILDSGKLHEHIYCLMEYINAPILSEKYNYNQLIEKGICFEMGEMLRKMHVPKAKGYGRIVAESAEFLNFNDWLTSADIQERVDYVHTNNLLTSEHGSLQNAFEILTTFIGENTVSSYCHDDFGANNIFATEPITVFDPNPRFNNGYIDLGRSLANYIAHDIFPEQLVNGYFNNEPYNKKVLHASIMLNICMKLPYSHKTSRLKNMHNWQEYLVKNKNLLETK